MENHGERCRNTLPDGALDQGKNNEKKWATPSEYLAMRVRGWLLDPDHDECQVVKWRGLADEFLDPGLDLHKKIMRAE